MHEYHPKGKKLPALEQNILKYRAFEMVIMLFHVEQLKSFVLFAVRATDKIRYPNDETRHRLPHGTKKLYEKIWALLVSDGILTQEESDDLQEIIDYRNQIAHSIENLTFDISKEPISERRVRSHGVKYEYDALKRLESYRDKIHKELSINYILPLGIDSLLFKSAEYTFKRELKRLDKKILRLLAIRNDEIKAIKSELNAIDPILIDEIDPDHPENLLQNGQLSKRGVKCCYTLFENGLSNLAVSYLMSISLKSITKRRKNQELENA